MDQRIEQHADLTHLRARMTEAQAILDGYPARQAELGKLATAEHARALADGRADGRIGRPPKGPCQRQLDDLDDAKAAAEADIAAIPAAMDCLRERLGASLKQIDDAAPVAARADANLAKLAGHSREMLALIGQVLQDRAALAQVERVVCRDWIVNFGDADVEGDLIGLRPTLEEFSGRVEAAIGQQRPRRRRPGQAPSDDERLAERNQASREYRAEVLQAMKSFRKTPSGQKAIERVATILATTDDADIHAQAKIALLNEALAFTGVEVRPDELPYVDI